MGGAWMGLTRHGRFAAVTNYRDGFPKGGAPRSRGELVGGYLTGTQAARPYLESVATRKTEYAGFGVLAGDLNALWFLSNYGNSIEAVAAGVHGLSNHLLDTPWPKVELGRQRVTALLDRHENELIDGLFTILAERTIAPDDALPETGVGLARERVLSPAFIASSVYGTRASTVVLIDKRGTVTFVERSYTAGGAFAGSTSNRFTLDQRVAAV